MFTWTRVLNGHHFEARTQSEQENTSPNSVRAQHEILKPCESRYAHARGIGGVAKKTRLNDL